MSDKETELENVRLILADTETTGFDPNVHNLVEIAWIELSKDLGILNTVDSLIDPLMPIPAGAMACHHITDAMVENEPTAEEFFFEVHDDPFKGDMLLIAHNSAFDRRFIEPWAQNIIGELCTLRMARRLLPGAPNYKLTTLIYHFGLTSPHVTPENAHRALADCYMTLSLLEFMIKESGLSFAELIAESTKHIPVDVMPFGKHKGVPLKLVPKSYVAYVLKNFDNLDVDLRKSLEAL